MKILFKNLGFSSLALHVINKQKISI